MTAAETDLATLLRTLEPDLDPVVYYFCKVDHSNAHQYVDLRPFAVIREAEGITLILSSPPDFVEERSDAYRRIELKVHSALNAVGLTAAVSSRLAENGIPANIIAGYHHDHVFVPAQEADRALTLLKSL